MIRIIDFEEDYLTSEMRRKKVVNPKWFRCPVNDSPEMQAILCSNPDDRVFGLAVLGAWEQLQRWCMRHLKRQGCFVMKNGTPMTLHQIAFAIGCGGHEDFLEKAVMILMDVGWLGSLDNVSLTVLRQPTPYEVGTVEAPPPLVPKSLPESTVCDEGRFSSTERYEHYPSVKALVVELGNNDKCPLATENPRKLETALCDAIVEGRDVERIVDAMSIYYSLSIGKDQYRTRPENFVRNRKDEENWDTWFNQEIYERTHFNSGLLEEYNDSNGGDEDSLKELKKKHIKKSPTEMFYHFKEWREKESLETTTEGDYEI